MQNSVTTSTLQFTVFMGEGIAFHCGFYTEINSRRCLSFFSNKTNYFDNWISHWCIQYLIKFLIQFYFVENMFFVLILKINHKLYMFLHKHYIINIIDSLLNLILLHKLKPFVNLNHKYLNWVSFEFTNHNWIERYFFKD